MKVRAKKSAPRWKGERQPPVPAKAHSFPAPVRGWVLNENPSTSQPGGARILDNWICTLRGARVRGGSVQIKDIGAPVRALMPYLSDVEKLFAASTKEIHDIDGGAVVTGLTSGDWSHVQFGTVAGGFLYAVNGADKALLFDGSTWTPMDESSTPAFTGVNTRDLSQCWSFASRLWFTEKRSLSAWYLPAGSIGGEAKEFSLASVFSAGGDLLFGAKWSLDAGDGLDDTCVFVTDQGEVAVYSGSDPASDFTKQGVYRIPRPLGKRAFTQAGGDLLIATEGGLIPISAVITTDRGAIEAKAVSAPIYEYWQEQAAKRRSRTWDMLKSYAMDALVVTLPATPSQPKAVLAANLLTGAWSRLTGWDAQCLAEFGGDTYFGDGEGRVFRADSGGRDNGEPYTATYLGLFESLGEWGAEKSLRQMRPLFEAATPFRVQVGAAADYLESTSRTPQALDFLPGDVWGQAIWGQAVWGQRREPFVKADWQAVGVTGYSLAPAIQITSDNLVAPDILMLSIDAQYTSGAVVT